MFSLLYLLTCLTLSTIFTINLELIATGLHQGKKFGKAKAEVEIYVDYEVNQNYSIKEFINILKNEGVWKSHPYCFSAEDNLLGGQSRITLHK